MCYITRKQNFLNVDNSVSNSFNEVTLAVRSSYLLNNTIYTGIVTTTRITHATPAGAYARSANRDWESDSAVRANGQDPNLCPDIAHQLVHSYPANQFKVCMCTGLFFFYILCSSATYSSFCYDFR